MKNYKERQLEKQELLIQNSDIFNGDKGNGWFMGKRRPFVLQNGLNNLYAPITEECISYFKNNDIAWWGGSAPNGHVLSSQIACLNHLFLLRQDKEAVLGLINGIMDCFTDVLPIPCDHNADGYIAFEMVSKADHLNEKQSSRGSNCTSVDAFVYAKHRDGRLFLIPIEWKYTERYPTSDKSHEDRMGEPKGSNGKGQERLKRYTALIDDSKQLKSLKTYAGSVYYQEPFYQLMRQTLWAEQMIKNYDSEAVKADDFLHMHVIPQENYELLGRPYHLSGKPMEETWRSLLNDNAKYVIVSPERLLSPVYERYPELISYLKTRYW